MKKNSSITILVFIIIALIIINCIFIVKYLDVKKQLTTNYDLTLGNAYKFYYRENELQQKINELEDELSKYDAKYKNIIDISFDGTIERIEKDNSMYKLIINEVNYDGEFGKFKDEVTVDIDDNTEIIINNDVKEISDLEEGQKASIYFSSEQLDEYPDEITNVQKVIVE